MSLPYGSQASRLRCANLPFGGTQRHRFPSRWRGIWAQWSAWLSGLLTITRGDPGDEMQSTDSLGGEFEVVGVVVGAFDHYARRSGDGMQCNSFLSMGIWALWSAWLSGLLIITRGYPGRNAMQQLPGGGGFGLRGTQLSRQLRSQTDFHEGMECNTFPPERRSETGGDEARPAQLAGPPIRRYRVAAAPGSITGPTGKIVFVLVLCSLSCVRGRMGRKRN